MTSPARILRVARWVLLAGALAGGVYLVGRFTVITLPAEGCSPVARFAAGASLLVDGSPRPLEPGDVVLVRPGDGSLQLTLVEEVRAADGALWCGGNVRECPGYGSDAVGWVPRDAVAGRVLVGWGP